MSFFRRLFNNPNDDDPTKDVVEETEKESSPPTKPMHDPLATGELQSNDDLPRALADTDKLDEETLASALSESKAGDLDEYDESTLPDREALGVTEELSPSVVMAGATRPLPDAGQFMPSTKGHLSFGQASDQGMVRLNNQDSAFSFFFTSETVDEYPDFGIFIVADGMGGHQDGEKASAITAKTLATEILSEIYTPLLDGVDMNDPDRPTIVDSMVEAVQKANRAVREKVADGGTTLTAVVVRGEAAHIAHVGDSRAYWITPEGTIEKITRDHSVVERLIELDQLTREEAEFHEQRNVLYRAIGQNEDVEVDIHRKRLINNSSLLICSDGLWNMVSDADILELVQNTPSPQKACEKLVALANAHGGTDNITAILIKTPTS